MALWCPRGAWRPPPSSNPGGQQWCSDLAITAALTRRLVFRWPVRQAARFIRSVLVDLDAPEESIADFGSVWRIHHSAMLRRER